MTTKTEQLLDTFQDAYRASFPSAHGDEQDHQEAQHEGIAAVLQALRDEILAPMPDMGIHVDAAMELAILKARIKHALADPS